MDDHKEILNDFEDDEEDGNPTKKRPVFAQYFALLLQFNAVPMVLSGFLTSSVRPLHEEADETWVGALMRTTEGKSAKIIAQGASQRALTKCGRKGHGLTVSGKGYDLDSLSTEGHDLRGKQVIFLAGDSAVMPDSELDAPRELRERWGMN